MINFLFVFRVCSLSDEHFTVQEKPAKGPLQGHRTGSVPVFDRLVIDNLRSSSSVRNHKGRGEFDQLMY